MSQITCLKILHYIRQNNECVSFESLSKLIEKYDKSYNYIDFNSIIDLCNEGYINIIDKDNNNISKSVCKMNYNELLDLYNKALNDVPIYVKLTNKLLNIQNLLGFSISDTITKLDNCFSTIATPIFGSPYQELQTDVFVIMPFKEEFDFLYNIYIKKVCEHLNISCKRADDLYSINPIMQDIWSLIFNSKVIIADCSTKNPNVMYELGIAHALGKKVILITQDINDIPFDLRHLRHLHYKYTPHSIEIFEDDLEYALAPLFE